MILNELVFNAVKHGASGKDKVPEVGVSIYQTDNDRIMVEVKNEGVSLPSDFDFEKDIGLGTGLTLLKSLLPHRGARLSIKNHNGGVRSQLILSSPVLLSISATNRVDQYG